VAEFTAAWNRHDIGALRGTLAPDVVIRQRGAAVTQRGGSYEVADAYGRHVALPAGASRSPADGWVTWATGWDEVARWADDLFQDGHQVEVGGYAQEGNVVRWTYRSTVEPYRTLGIEPAVGSAEATISGEKIAALILESRPDVAARREAALQAANQQAAAQAAALWEAAHGVTGGPAATTATSLPATAEPETGPVTLSAPDTQQRTTAGMAGWMVAAMAIAGSVGLALTERRGGVQLGATPIARCHPCATGEAAQARRVQAIMVAQWTMRQYARIGSRRARRCAPPTYRVTSPASSGGSRNSPKLGRDCSIRPCACLP
jgi:hypothetical protein